MMAGNVEVVRESFSSLSRSPETGFPPAIGWSLLARYTNPENIRSGFPSDAGDMLATRPETRPARESPVFGMDHCHSEYVV
jgi:hypothetical protein